MANELAGRTVAILVENGFEQIELVEPRRALDRAGARTVVVSPAGEVVRAWNGSGWGRRFGVDVPLSDAREDEHDALLLPGGVMNPDRLRMNPEAIRFVRAFFEAGKPVACICHGAWTLIEAGVVRGRRVTSYPSLRTDLENAGAEWVDEPAVVDDNLLTSRRPGDLPAFNRRMLTLFTRGAVRRAA